MNNSDQIQVTASEADALRRTWDNLGPLISLVIRELGREKGLALCNGLASGALLPMWTLHPELTTLTIWKGDEKVHWWAFPHEPARFVFAEIGEPN